MRKEAVTENIVPVPIFYLPSPSYLLDIQGTIVTAVSVSVLDSVMIQPIVNTHNGQTMEIVLR